VSWASAPGYVGWCPIGYCGGGGFSFGVSFGVPWGWVVVSRPYFGHKYPVHHHALPPAAIPHRTPFAVQARAPLAPPVAVPRPRAIPRPPAGGPVSIQSAGAVSSRPRAVNRGAGPIAPNQPELAGARAVPRSQSRAGASPSVAASGQPGAPQTQQPGVAGQARARSRYVVPRERTVDGRSNVNRYVPDTRTLGGVPAAIPRQAAPSAPRANDSASSTPVGPGPSASPRWYPPVTMTRPRAEQTPAAPPQTPVYRTGPDYRSPSPTVRQPGQSARGGAQPRQPAGSPPVSAFQPPRMRSPSEAPRSFGAPPAGLQQRAPTAVPRGTPAPGPARQGAPAQPPGRAAAPPAGARSPRSR
jgi:hypothetical protein